MLKIATWNVNSLRVRLPQVQSWLSTMRPDILAVQETKLSDPDFPTDALISMGYYVAYAGQKTYNGVAIMSRTPIRDVVTDVPGWDDPQRRILAATIAGIRVINLYVPNGEEVNSEKYRYKLDWLKQVGSYIQAELAVHSDLVVLGDLNIAPEDRDVHDPLAWQDHVLVSPSERQAFQGWLVLGLKDLFRLFPQSAESYSWWDYRQQAFKRRRGLRIDHLLASTALASRCQSCEIDTTPRSHERPSDHAPVWAAFS